MRRILLLFILSITLTHTTNAQVEQTHRFELEKKNTDNYFSVLSAGEDGLVVFRDTDDYKKGEGNEWQVIALDTALQEKWEIAMTINLEYTFKGFELAYGHLYLLFRTGEYVKSDYHLVDIDIEDGTVNRYDMPNEIEMYPSHMIIFEDKLILGAYVKKAPTLFSYTFGDNKMEVIKGFFKDKTELVDLTDNENGTFNTVSLEKDYAGSFLKFRTYSNEGDILFERDVEMEDDHRILSAKSTSLAGGNIAITGTYSSNNSYFSQGIYFAIVKPEGQKNVIRHYDFDDFEHFFDYLNPNRAERIQRKIQEKAANGKEFKYSSRINLHKVQTTEDGYLLAAEIYNPQFDNAGSRFLYNDPYSASTSRNTGRANYGYVKQVSRLQNLEEASAFKYIQSLIIKLDNNGKIKWDNSMKIDDLETESLEQVVDFTESNGTLNMVYLNDEQIIFKTVDKNESVPPQSMDLKLKFPTDDIRHTYNGMGGAVHWYDNNFFVWGYHKVENKVNSEIEPRRSVLYINKIEFK